MLKSFVALQAPAAPAATDRLPGYSVGKTIGEGGFCKVRLGVHDLSGQRVAIKVIDKSKLKVSTQRLAICCHATNLSY